MFTFFHLFVCLLYKADHFWNGDFIPSVQGPKNLFWQIQAAKAKFLCDSPGFQGCWISIVKQLWGHWIKKISNVALSLLQGLSGLLMY